MKNTKPLIAALISGLAIALATGFSLKENNVVRLEILLVAINK